MLNILIIDDIESNLLVLENIFEENFDEDDYNLIKASNGVDALKILLNNHIDLILTDYAMPNMNGLEFVEILKKNNKLKKIPVFILTAYSSFNDVSIENKFLELGVFEFLTKPTNPLKLKNKIDILLGLIKERKKDKLLIEQAKEIKKQIEENQEKDKMLLQQSKLAIMGEMLSMIAHQWRQPLNAINGVVMTMNMQKKLDLLDDDNFNKNLKNIKNSTKFLSNTIDDFRKFFDKNKKVSEIYLEDLIQKIINLVSHRINKSNVEIIKNCNCKKSISTYSNELQQVILNIFNNAFDEFESKKMEKPILKISVKEINNDFIEILISDNAGGIPKDIIHKIFDPYFSTKSKNGTGLGLYMSKMIIHDSLKGELYVQNNEDGAVFTIKIPNFFERDL